MLLLEHLKYLLSFGLCSSFLLISCKHTMAQLDIQEARTAPNGKVILKEASLSRPFSAFDLINIYPLHGTAVN